MREEELQKKISFLNHQQEKLQAEYKELEKDKLMIYNLLYKVNHELDEALHNKQTFITSISHELRSPLTAILGYSELLEDSPLNDEQRKYLNRLDKSGRYLLSLVSDLLDASKLKDSKVKLDIKEINLYKVLIECANMVESKIPKDVDFIVNISQIPYYIYADKKRIQQIFLNILTNAAKFTKKGQIKFTLHNLYELEEYVQFTIDVIDTGSGIPKDIENSLFEPFESRDTREGTGLGLYISQELANLMNGNIIVDSKEGQGSTFRVTFSCKKSNKKYDAITDKNLMSIKKSKTSYAHLHGLIVEDIPINREYINEMLKKFFDISCDNAENGAVAIEKVRKNNYDFILMDMRMPIMNGIEATKKIRQFNQEIPIICMSANVYREDKHAAEEAGMNDFIEKPLEKSDIESTLLGLESIQNIKHKEIIIQKNLKVRAFKHLIQYFDEEQSKKIITLAEQSIENYIKSIETNWENKDMQSLIENFHTIKGIVSNLGLNNIADNAMFLQNAAKISNLKVEPEKEALILDLKGFLVSNI